MECKLGVSESESTKDDVRMGSRVGCAEVKLDDDEDGGTRVEAGAGPGGRRRVVCAAVNPAGRVRDAFVPAGTSIGPASESDGTRQEAGKRSLWILVESRYNKWESTNGGASHVQYLHRLVRPLTGIA